MRAAPAASPSPAAAAVAAQWAQSLADGAPGIALWHIERARAQVAGWQPVHRLAVAMTRQPVRAHPEVATLFWGAPAVAYALHAAGQRAYRTALDMLDHTIATLIRVRLDAAHRRIEDRQLAQAREYDLINGLTGLGAYLMHRHHDHQLLREILGYLVRLTRPIQANGETLPGWWATGSPDRRPSPRWDAGHAGFGMAHGIAGPLALLSAAMRRGINVHGHGDAIHTICAWLDQWQRGNAGRAWWPEVIDRHAHRTGTSRLGGPHRPSWCYGTPGIARAQQLAAIAVGDPARACRAERALAGCLTDHRQLALLTDAGLCHGWAGLVHTARRAAADARTSNLAAAADEAATRTWQRLREQGTPAAGGLLEGATGIALASTGSCPAPSAAQPGWDTCLLVG